MFNLVSYHLTLIIRNCQGFLYKKMPPFLLGGRNILTPGKKSTCCFPGLSSEPCSTL